MNCQEFWNQAPQGSRSPGAELAAHLSECPACASAWAVQRNVAAGLQQVAADWSRMGAPARVETRLVSLFREQAGMPPGRRSRPWIAVLTWAAAAAAMLVLAFSLMRVHAPQTATPKPIPPNTPIFAVVQGVADGSVAAENSGPDAGFIPLPNVEQLASNEQGDLVRVEVPRSAMIAVGFEVGRNGPRNRCRPKWCSVPIGVAHCGKIPGWPF